jgi:hypothetical protein
MPVAKPAYNYTCHPQSKTKRRIHHAGAVEQNSYLGGHTLLPLLSQQTFGAQVHIVLCSFSALGMLDDLEALVPAWGGSA